MGFNRYRPHVLILPEDSANSQIATGFLLSLETFALAKLRILPVGRGWQKCLDQFATTELPGMNLYPHRHLIILIDFDGEKARRDFVMSCVPADLKNRVFVLGSLTNPEELKRAQLGNYEEIGSRLAQDCRARTNLVWSHELLEHNASELDRLRETIWPILEEPAN